MAGGQEMKKSYFEGWLEHRAGGGGSKEKYTYLWIVLRKRKLYIHSNNEEESVPIGSLSLDRFTTVKRMDKGGYKIELSTVSTQPSDGTPMTFKHNTFKSTTKADRNLWYAFISAISQGAVPCNVTLNPSVKTMIEDALQDCVRPDNTGSLLREQHPHARLQRASTEPYINVPSLPPKTDLPSPSGWPDRPPPPPPVEETPAGRQRRASTQSENQFNRPLPAVPGRSAGYRISSISSGSDDSSSRRSGTDAHSYGAESRTTSFDDYDRSDGPFMFHKFYMNKGNCHNVPSWFFENCTRDNSEMVLMLGKRYGNVMMRESTTYRQSGSYVIDIREETPRGSGIRHFEVIRVAEGFQIDLLDKEHEPMCCLTEVMNFFTQCMGPDFRPMSTNDRSLIGLPEPEYDRVLNLPQKACSPTAKSPPTDDEIYTLPDNFGQGEKCVPNVYEEEYMDMQDLKESIGQTASISRSRSSISRSRPRPSQQPPQQAHGVSPSNNQLCKTQQGSPNNPFLNPRLEHLSMMSPDALKNEPEKYDPRNRNSLEKFFQ